MYLLQRVSGVFLVFFIVVHVWTTRFSPEANGDLFGLMDHGVSGRDLILLVGGLFLIAKATYEIHDKVEGEGEHGLKQRRRASFGVACVPQTSTGKADLIPMADAALYAAKQAGRNCVRAATARAPRGERIAGNSLGPRLTAV